jgi:8-amino-7-oxononanoate synthase
MTRLESVTQARLAALETQSLRRNLCETQALGGTQIRRGGRELISFSSNDYLGLAQHPDVIAAAQAALAAHGSSAGASRLVTGSHPLYAPLEAALAEAKGYEAALVYGSGYLANLGVLSALMAEGDLILLDKLAHACLLDGAQLSGARWMRFKHNDPQDLARLLEKHRAEYRHCLIVTETVFSMDGDRAPINALRILADQHDSWLMADDAHGLFCAPDHSRPDSVPHAGKDYAGINLLTGTLSKALGAYGGYACAAQSVIDYLATASRSFLFTTGLPPATIAGANAALTLAQAEPWRAEQALGHARRFCTALGLPEPESQVVPVLFGEAEDALAAMHVLEAKGLLVTAIRPPTVPKGTARLRVSFSAAHTDAQVEALIAAIRPLLNYEKVQRHA